MPVDKNDTDVGAGNQGIMFGYTSDETSDYMPLAHSMATRLGKVLSEVSKAWGVLVAAPRCPNSGDS